VLSAGADDDDYDLFAGAHTTCHSHRSTAAAAAAAAAAHDDDDDDENVPTIEREQDFNNAITVIDLA